MNDARDRIRILLLEDRPGLLIAPGRPCPSLAAAHPGFEWFDIRWLATAGEAREFRDLSRRLGQADPVALGREGWVPEVLVVDYSLKDDPEERVENNRVAARLDPARADLRSVSPLPSLVEAAARKGIVVDGAGTEFDGASHCGGPVTKDLSGCFVGGLIGALFSDHPCAILASTVRETEQVKDTYADLLEWVLKDETAGQLCHEERKCKNWDEVFAKALPQLQERIVELARSNVITLSLGDLLSLSVDGNHAALGARSRYGWRRWPVQAMFLDVPVVDRPERARAWGEKLIQGMLADVDSQGHECLAVSTMLDLVRGLELVTELWGAYCSTWCDRRFKVSLLAQGIRDGQRPASDLSNEEQLLLADFGLDSQRDVCVFGPACGAPWTTIERPGREYADVQKRWAALLMVIKLLRARWRIEEAARETLVREGIDDYGPVFEPVGLHDVFLALYPIAETPQPLPWHQPKGAPTSSWPGLKRLHSGRNGPKARAADPGDLWLDIQDVLDGGDWHEGMRDERRDPDQREIWKGVLASERRVLRWFAEDEFRDCESEAWRNDPTIQRVLFGRHARGTGARS